MDTFQRLIRFGSTVAERAAPIWRSATVHLARAASVSAISLGAAIERGLQWLMSRRRMMLWAAGIGIAVALLIGFVFGGGSSWIWGKYHSNREDLTPLLTLAAGVAVAGVALARHFAQTNADRQRRITESFSKAVEQLGSDKLEVRLGGIYALERISTESPDDYWTVMENLTAFVRERSRRNEAERLQNFEQRVSRRAYFLWLEAGGPGGRAEDFWTQAAERDAFGDPPGTDIAAVLTVIDRRSERDRKREYNNLWRLDLSDAILRQATFFGMNLKGSTIDRGIHLERAYLTGVHLERAFLRDAHLELAFLQDAHLEKARLQGAHLAGAHLEGANLKDTVGLSEAQLAKAHGDAATRLPAGLARPEHWPAPDAAAKRVTA